mmetsp:Transcript_6277/g.7209  ORF Transcript_6277/g.7209 Transcript_6277/m.7209 type:complete len:363 (+) Transcript_6277:102-1190(+)
MAQLFDIFAFFIVFREALEAAIVCAVLLGVLQKSNQVNLKKWVWIGLAAGLLLTTIILIGVVVAFQVASSGFSFRANKLTQGILGVTAAVLIAYVALTISELTEKRAVLEEYVLETMEDAESVDEDLSEEERAEQLQKRLEEAPKDDTWKTIFFLSFTAVAREGFETIVFLGVGSGFEATALPIPILTGGALGAFCGYMMYKSSGRVTMERFLQASVVLLLFVGAGIFTHGIFEFQELKDWGWWEIPVYNLTPVCCSLKEQGWSLARALFGFTPYPSRAEMLSYFMYWLFMIISFQIKWYLKRHNISKDDLKAKALSVFGCEKGKTEESSSVEEAEKEIKDLEAEGKAEKDDVVVVAKDLSE